MDGGQVSGNVASWWQIFCWDMQVKSLSAEREQKTKAEIEPFVSVQLCVSVCVQSYTALVFVFPNGWFKQLLAQFAGVCVFNFNVPRGL